MSEVGSQPSCPECHAWPYEAHRPDCSQRAGSAMGSAIREAEDRRSRAESERDLMPRLDAARKGVFDWHSMLTERTPAADIAARVSALLVAEDERMRRDVLPASPAGYEWDSTLEPTSEPDGIIGDVRLRLVYRLRKVEP